MSSKPATVTRPAEQSAPAAGQATMESSAPTPPDVGAPAPQSGDDGAAAREAAARAQQQADDEAELEAMAAEEAALIKRRETAEKKRSASERLNKLREETALAEAAALSEEGKVSAPPVVMYRDPAKIKELETELALAKKTEQEAFQAARAATADNITSQSRANNGEVDHDVARKKGEDAAEAVRRKAYAGRKRGLVVKSNLETSHPSGNGRVTLTPGMRVPEGMLAHYPPEMLQQLIDDGILEDLR